MHERFLERLGSRKANYLVVSGDRASRLAAATEACDMLLAQPTKPT